MLRAIIIMFLLIDVITYAQRPAYFKLGEEQFSNTDIYTLLYNDNDDVLYVGTNNGLFAYKQNHFIKLEGPKNQIGSSVFQLKQNKKGVIYCCNLNGQIFKVVENSFELFYEVSQDEITNYFNYYIDVEDSIITQSMNVVRKLDVEGNSRVLLDSGGHYVWNSPQTLNGDIYLYKGNNTGFKYSVDGFSSLIYKSNNKLSESILFSLDNKAYVLSENSCVTSDQVPIITDFNFKEKEVFYTLKSKKLIGLDRKKGIRIIGCNNDTLKEESSFFKNTFISSVFENKKEVLFLGTFGEGIIVIPKKEVVKYNYNHLFLGIAVSSNNNLFLTTRGGEIYKKEDSLELVYKRNTNIDRAFFIKGDYELKDDTSTLSFFSKDKNIFIEGDDAVEIEDEFIVWANFMGVEMSTKSGEIPADLDYIYANRTRIRIVKEKRCKSVTFSPNDSSFYYSTNFGVFNKEWSSPNTERLLFKGKSILGNDLECYKGQLVCGTEEYGVLFYEDNKVVKQLIKDNGLKSNTIKKIKVKNNWLFILTKIGMQVYDLDQGKFLGLGVSEGAVFQGVTNFALSNNKLWLLEKHSFYDVNFSEIEKSERIANLYLDSIVVNKRTVNYKNEISFNADENKFHFYFDYRAIESKSETKLLYTLEGFYSDWKNVSTNVNKIEFQSLPSGNYVFKIKGVYRGQETKTFEYKFKIKVPYWQRWWFYLLMSVSFTLVLAVVFRIRLERQKKEARLMNELNTSKLTAIQSQMNPHFIFNALNSIQALVLRGDIDNSYAYINEFSDLVRKTLNYSEKDFISFEDELRLINIYLTLENLRFREDFEYSIKTLDSEVQFSVPPMLIQPFIENALVHGLLHRDGLKKIKISFELRDVLICTIEDNGIGREASKEINKRQNPKHASFAIDAIQNRLNILSHRFKNPIGFEYQDVLDENEKVVGTITRINIPILIEF